MNRFLFATLPVLLLMTTGCVVAPRQPAPYPSVYPATYPSAYPPAYADEYVPPPEYVVDGPLYYDTYPGIPFYPIFIDTPGSCFCVMPMRYYGGVWLGVTGVVIHRGFFPYRRVEPVHRSYWQQQGGVVNGMRPSRGAFESRDGRMHPLPPAGSIHFRAVEQRSMNRPAPMAPNSGPSGQSTSPQRPFQNQGQPPPVLVPQNRPVQATPAPQPQFQQQPPHQPQQPQAQHQPQPQPQQPQLQRPFSHPVESSPRGASPQNRSGPPDSRSGQPESRSRSNRCQDDDKHEKRC